MTTVSVKALSLLFAMLFAAALSAVATPRTRIADQGPKVDLEVIVPREFAGWHVDTQIKPVIASPDAQAILNKIYNQTLSRTYVNPNGDRVMLSMAYGGDQSDAMQVHKPEVCYPAQGFSVLKILKAQLTTPFGALPVTRLVAQQGPRNEPITYWITVGDHVALSGLDRKLQVMKYGLTGRVPDGMLVRVSSIDRDEANAYRIQEEFLNAMLASLDPGGRVRVAGRPR